MSTMSSLADIQHELRPELGPGERLLWSGRPRQGVVFRAIDLFLIPFILIWAGIPTAAAIGFIRSGKPIGTDIFFLPFILIGAYKKGSDPRTDYALTKLNLVNAFLRQGTHEPTASSAAIAQLHKMF